MREKERERVRERERLIERELETEKDREMREREAEIERVEWVGERDRENFDCTEERKTIGIMGEAQTH